MKNVSYLFTTSLIPGMYWAAPCWRATYQPAWVSVSNPNQHDPVIRRGLPNAVRRSRQKYHCVSLSPSSPFSPQQADSKPGVIARIPTEWSWRSRLRGLPLSTAGKVAFPIHRICTCQGTAREIIKIPPHFFKEKSEGVVGIIFKFVVSFLACRVSSFFYHVGSSLQFRA
jgi:hypothetical protein